MRESLNADDRWAIQCEKALYVVRCRALRKERQRLRRALPSRGWTQHINLWRTAEEEPAPTKTKPKAKPESRVQRFQKLKREQAAERDAAWEKANRERDERWAH